ncbi:MAG: lysophospholipase [Anaerolineae bacterium]|nr:lysophospholipase [Anaerolineae bacterium]
MEHQAGSFRGIRNHNIYYQSWLPQGDPRAVVLIVHGLGEHSGRYMNVVNQLVPRGYALYALDHIGHGKSDGTRMVVNRFDDYTDTLALYLDMVRGWQPGKPVVLLGHSMGGLIATAYLLDHQDAFVCAVISAPSVKLPADISPLTLALARILSIFMPKIGLAAVDPALVSRDPAVVQDYIDDPLVYKGKNTARLSAELISAIHRVENEAASITLPVLIVQGSEDKLVDPAGAQMLYDRISSQDKTLNMYEGLFHEVCNEPECAIVLSDIEQWLDAHIGQPSKGG